MYQSNYIINFREVDNWENGCDPDTASSYSYNADIRGKTKEEYINNLLNYFDVDKDALELNSCDEIGRIDLMRLETDQGDNATSEQIEKWKQGKQVLYNAIYTVYVNELIPVEF